MASPTTIPRPARFRVSGGEPASVRAADAADRLAYWRAFVEFAKETKARELARGLDRFGRERAPLAAATIAHRRSAMGPADPVGPALQPAHGLSRTRSLFVGEATPDGAIFGWLVDPHTGKPWGRILQIHRKGDGVPVRDVIGLSPASLAEARRRAAAWWEDYLAGRATTPTAATPTYPDGRPKFLVDRVPPYVPKNPANAIPKANRRIGQVEINGDVYTLQGGSAASIRRGIADGSFSGFRGRAERAAERARLGLRPSPPPGPPPAAPPAKPRPKAAPKPPPAPAVVRTPADAARLARSLGAKVVVLDRKAADKYLGKRVPNVPAAYEAVSDTIWINPFATTWSDPAELTRMRETGWWVGDSYADVVHHELGHRAHRHALGLADYAAMTGLPVRDSLREAIVRHVSRYAATQRKEFVAEVYAMLRAGRTLPEEILEYYDKLGGVRP